MRPAMPPADDAIISPCGRYRYVLTRHIGRGRRTATFVLLNPSTADAARDDPTIRRCRGFARRWRCGRLVVLNVFALRATDPAELRRAADPVGPENAAWFERLLINCDGPIVCGWGTCGTLLDQDLIVRQWLDDLGARTRALGVTKHGQPLHPLYLPYTSRLRPYTDPSRAKPLSAR